MMTTVQRLDEFIGRPEFADPLFAGADKLNMPKALQLLKEALEEKGEDYVYDSGVAGAGSLNVCFNWDVNADVPGCIVGYVLSRWGMPKDRILRDNTHGVGSFSEAMTPLTLYLLGRVQEQQDQQISWGAAVNEGLDYIEEARGLGLIP